MKSVQRSLQAAKRGIVNLSCRTNLGFRCYLRFRHGMENATQKPQIPPYNGTLKNRCQCDQALADVRRLGLVPHPDAPKNWDALMALSLILSETTKRSSILDAGAELYSPILPSLFLHGYYALFGVNCDFKEPMRRGPIRYLPGDITRTTFSPALFDAVTCLSVIEHGVDSASYFAEMSRILKPGGILITSTDFWPEAVDTRGAVAYGTPVKIFTRQEIQSMVELSSSYGLELTGPLDLTSGDKLVKWKRFGLEYTFVIFALRKRY